VENELTAIGEVGVASVVGSISRNVESAGARIDIVGSGGGGKRDVCGRVSVNPDGVDLGLPINDV
jgi:hypothetical protein